MDRIVCLLFGMFAGSIIGVAMLALVSINDNDIDARADDKAQEEFLKEMKQRKQQ